MAKQYKIIYTISVQDKTNQSKIGLDIANQNTTFTFEAKDEGYLEV